MIGFSCVTLLFHLAVSQVPRYPISDRGSCVPLNLWSPFSNTSLLARSLFPDRVYSEYEVQVRITDTKNTCESPGLIRGTVSSVTATVEFRCTGEPCPTNGVYQYSYTCSKKADRFSPLNGRLTKFQTYDEPQSVRSGCGGCSSFPISDSGCTGRLCMPYAAYY